MSKEPSGLYHLGLLGYPLGHSLSPVLHEYALEYAHLEGSYRLFPIAPGPDRDWQIKAMLDQIREKKLSGLNITIPFKQMVIPYLDYLSPLAEATRAVNTVYLQGDRLLGSNTDVLGFEFDLAHLVPLTSDKARHALILGAGGTARAVAYALCRNYWSVYIAARRQEQAAQLIADILAAQPFSKLQWINYSPECLQVVSSECDLLVNSTSVGLYPEIDASPWPKDIPLPHVAAVYDVIYNPKESLLLKLARCERMPMRNGLGMLLGQAAASFSLWTGAEIAPESLYPALSAN